MGHAISRPDFSSRDGIGTALSAALLRSSIASGLKPDAMELESRAATITCPPPPCGALRPIGLRTNSPEEKNKKGNDTNSDCTGFNRSNRIVLDFGYNGFQVWANYDVFNGINRVSIYFSSILLS